MGSIPTAPAPVGASTSSLFNAPSAQTQLGSGAADSASAIQTQQQIAQQTNQDGTQSGIIQAMEADIKSIIATFGQS